MRQVGERAANRSEGYRQELISPTGVLADPSVLELGMLMLQNSTRYSWNPFVTRNTSIRWLSSRYIQSFQVHVAVHFLQPLSPQTGSSSIRSSLFPLNSAHTHAVGRPRRFALSAAMLPQPVHDALLSN